jgi:hypothetical protein
MLSTTASKIRGLRLMISPLSVVAARQRLQKCKVPDNQPSSSLPLSLLPVKQLLCSGFYSERLMRFSAS